MKKIISIFILSVILISCDDDDINIDDGITHIKPEFIVELFPKDDAGIGQSVSKNVIQGITSFENGWFTTQKSNGGIFLINYINANGVSLFHKRFTYNAHGQDLSLEQLSENQIMLYTTKGTFGETRNTGITKLLVDLSPAVGGVRDWSMTDITLDNQYNLDYTNSTPTLNEAKDKFAIRSKNTILVHDKLTLESSNFTPLYRFELHSEQLIDNGGYSMFFQGIAMKEDIVFCLTGNGEFGTEKKIFSYNSIGQVQNRYVFDRNDLNQPIIDKLEPEGLSFINDNLYFTIMTKPSDLDGNRKYLYKIDL